MPLEKSINEDNIVILVRHFYSKVLEDSILAPFFVEKLGKDIKSDVWEAHLLLLIEFWKFVALGYDEYDGNPLQPHFHIENLTEEAFRAWLSLFHTTIDSIYIPSIGQYFKDKSDDIAQNFMRRLFE